jgi:hypothetical protein
LSSQRRPFHVTARNVVARLSGVNEPSMIILMTTSRRQQLRYDHRLRELVRATGNVTIATDLGLPRSTVRGWLRKAPVVVVSLDVTNLRTPELQQEILALRRRVRKLTALLRLALALLRSAGFTLAHERLPNGRDKTRILRAVDRAREFVPLRPLLRFLRLSPSRCHAWRRLQDGCALDDQSSCPHTSPHRLTPREILAIKDIVTAPDCPAISRVLRPRTQHGPSALGVSGTDAGRDVFWPRRRGASGPGSTRGRRTSRPRGS